jgi:hypothetical protein
MQVRWAGQVSAVGLLDPALGLSLDIEEVSPDFRWRVAVLSQVRHSRARFVNTARPLVSVAAKRGTILAAMAVSWDQPFNWSLSLLTGRLRQNGPEPVKGAPLLGAAKRTLDGEDSSGIIKKEGKAPARVCQSGPVTVAPSWPPLTTARGQRWHFAYSDDADR